MVIYITCTCNWLATYAGFILALVPPPKTLSRYKWQEKNGWIDEHNLWGTQLNPLFFKKMVHLISLSYWTFLTEYVFRLIWKAPSLRQTNTHGSKHTCWSDMTRTSILTSAVYPRKLLPYKKKHLERPAAVGEQRTHWGSPWGGRSWDSWHRAPRVSLSVPCSGCSSPQTSAVPSIERPAAQTVFTA